MPPRSRSRLLTGACALLGLALSSFSATAAPASTLNTPSRTHFHTSSGHFEPGCARSFLFDGPASEDGLRAPFTLNVTVSRSSTLPVISSQLPSGASGSSSFTYSYNAAAFPLMVDGVFQSNALLVRCQNQLNASDPYSVGPSSLVLAVEDPSAPGVFNPISDEDVVFQATEPFESFGTEDPRVVYDPDTKQYFLFYSAVQNDPDWDPPVMSRLSLATTTDIRNISAWNKYGPIIQNGDDGTSYVWSKSGALLKAPQGQKSLLIFGDSSIENGVQTALPSDDFLSYKYNSSLFLPIRSDSFDSNLVEAGPPPLQLSNGMYLFIYNSARLGYPSAKPGWDTQYNVGFALLDGDDPDTILLRSDQPLLSPELDWELGLPPWLGLTPNVVFVEGARQSETNPDLITFFYGAADSVVGMGTITVDLQGGGYLQPTPQDDAVATE